MSTYTATDLQHWFTSTLGEWLGMDPATVDVSETFTNYALDSAGAMRLLGLLEEMLQRPLEPTLFIDFPNIKLLSEHLAEG